MTAPSQPWSAEIEPDAALVAALVARHWPDLAGRVPALVGRGWENVVWGIGEWLVRLPLRAAVAERAVGELAAMRLVAPRIGAWVPVPARIAPPDAHFPWPAWLVARAPGAETEPALPAASDARAVARSAGVVLTALHGLDARAAAASGFVVETGRDTLYRVMRHTAEILPVLGDRVDGALLSAAARACARAEVERPSRAAAPVPCHRDLRGAHVFASQDRVTALLDWSDAGLSDPALDFAGLWCIGGAEFVTEALSAYGGLRDAGLLARTRLYALAAAVTTLRYGIEADLAQERAIGARVLESVVG